MTETEILVAQAIHRKQRASMRADSRYWDSLNEQERHSYIQDARAAFEALRSQGMIRTPEAVQLCEHCGASWDGDFDRTKHCLTGSGGCPMNALTP